MGKEKFFDSQIMDRGRDREKENPRVPVFSDMNKPLWKDARFYFVFLGYGVLVGALYLQSILEK